MANDIIRSPTSEEKDLRHVGTDGDTIGFIPIVDPSKRELTPEEKFNQKLAEEMQKAQKARKPFCDRAVREVIKDWREEVSKEYKKQGFVPQELMTPPKINWNKYSDLDNFKVVEEGETFDEHLTRLSPGLSVFAKFTRYQFKGYSNVYTIMEDATQSIIRARQKLKELESETPKKK